MKILIDGDPLCYRCGPLGEERIYEVVYEDANGEMQVKMFENGNDIRPFFKDSPNIEKVGQELIRTRKELGFALGPLRLSLDAMITAVVKRFKVKDEDLDVQVFLTGTGNFRDEVAKERPYKGTRDRTARPLWYKEIREYLVKSWKAKIVVGHEADDEISILAREYWREHVSHIVLTVDKDLDQIPGPHYDYGKKTWYHMDEEDCTMFFYTQVLQGDTTDNIPGVYRLGKVNAKAIIKDACAEYYATPSGKRDMSLEAWLWAVCLKTYEDSVAKYPKKYIQDNAYDIAVENARLVKMQEFHGQMWEPINE